MGPCNKARPLGRLVDAPLPPEGDNRMPHLCIARGCSEKGCNDGGAAQATYNRRTLRSSPDAACVRRKVTCAQSPVLRALKPEVDCPCHRPDNRISCQRARGDDCGARAAIPGSSLAHLGGPNTRLPRATEAPPFLCERRLLPNRRAHPAALAAGRLPRPSMPEPLGDHWEQSRNMDRNRLLAHKRQGRPTWDCRETQVPTASSKGKERAPGRNTRCGQSDAYPCEPSNRNGRHPDAVASAVTPARLANGLVDGGPKFDGAELGSMRAHMCHEDAARRQASGATAWAPHRRWHWRL